MAQLNVGTRWCAASVVSRQGMPPGFVSPAQPMKAPSTRPWPSRLGIKIAVRDGHRQTRMSQRGSPTLPHPPSALLPSSHGGRLVSAPRWIGVGSRYRSNSFRCNSGVSAGFRRASLSSSGRKPVDAEILSGIPWAGRSTLACLMHRVASDGPRDPAVWRRLVARADVIAHSMTTKQAALTLSALARVQYRDESFLRRFCVRFVPSLLPDAELIDLCGIVSSLSQLGAYNQETFNLLAKRAVATVPQMDPRQLSLVANAFSRVGHADRELFERILVHMSRRLTRFDARDIAVLLNALCHGAARSSLGAHQDVAAEAEADSIEMPNRRQGIDEQLEAVALRLPDLLPTADLHSLALILNAFAQLGFTQKDALDLIIDELLSDERSRLDHITPRQLSMLLNAAGKLQLFEPRLLEALAGKVRVCAPDLDAQALCVVANACAKLRFGVDTFGVLYAQVPRRLARLNGRQLAMLAHAWAKAHIHNDDLFALLALPLAQRADELLAHEVAITVYGYAHFRKAPEELFGKLLRRFAELLKKGGVKDGDLLMVGNALGRVGVRDEAVAECLVAYVRREPGYYNLSPQAIATYALAPADDMAVA
eukprot:TRINITY_DN39336_c0_g1_i1.p1 TRINITY_DN39336_c0_g1~~TRINITY_DN39336_c0_g1_i1.p1  ORF type:complete len:596 (+),score=89.98 TRINITY_DN39336_c0_g1_i1:94-1881(+)